MPAKQVRGRRTSARRNTHAWSSAKGQVLAATSSPSWQRPLLSGRSGSGVPVLLADSAYNRTTGTRLWTNPELVAGTQGTVVAVAEDVVYLRDPTNDSETGIDLNTGKRLWHNATTEMFTPTSATGTVLAGTDGIALTAFDAKTGTVVWTAPLVAIDPDPEALASGGAIEPYDDGWIFSSDRTMIGLAPL